MNRRFLNRRGLAAILVGLLALPVASAADQEQTPAAEAIDVAGAPTLGRDDAPATLVIFAELGGVTVGGLGVILHGLVERYPTSLRVCFRHASSADRPDQVLAHRAAIAAGEQGKFWEMLDLLLANRTRHDSESLVAVAKQLALDPTRFSEDIDSVTTHQRIDVDRQQSAALNLGANPTFFVNGRRLAGVKSLAELSAQVDAVIAQTPGAGLANR